jgi:hypothetical protein
MSDENEKKSVTDSLRDWGIDVEKFEERAKESMQNARGDLSEITGTLRHTLVQAKEVLIGLQKSPSPVATEIKTGFERAWREIEAAFAAARQKAKEANNPPSAPETPEPPAPDARQANDAPQANDEPPAGDEPPSPS